MKETIILSNINKRELLRSLSIKGLGFLNVRILNSNELALEALLRNGKILTSEVISKTRQECIVYNLLKDVDYFKDSNFLDAININQALNYSRFLCRNEEANKINEVLGDGEFKDKNLALNEVYRAYKEYLKTNNLIDSIDVINDAINTCDVINSDFIVFKETPLEPLEEELLKVLSNDNFRELSIKEFVGINDKPYTNITYDNAYGAINELEYILAYIVKNNIRYEDVTIAITDRSYINHLLSLKDTHDIKMSFGVGYNLSNSSAFKVLNQLLKWDKGYNGVDSFKGLIYGNEFNTNKFFDVVGLSSLKPRDKDKIITTIGNLRISVLRDDRLDKYYASLSEKEDLDNFVIVKNIAEELYKGYSYLIRNYSNINDSDFDISSIEYICLTLDEYFKYVEDGSLEVIVKTISDKFINLELSKEGSICVSDLSGALSSIRKHLFITGLNAKNFPGSPSENYLLLDSDLMRFNEELVKTSNRKVNLNKELLFNVLDNASAFNVSVHMSYAGYNLAELKAENPSSLLFEVFKKEHGQKVSMEDFEKEVGEQHSYFDEDISSLKNIGKKYLEGYLFKEETSRGDTLSKVSIDYAISPSSADKFFSCEKRFYLTQILGIVEPQDDDTLKALPANYEGSLIHKCMEDYGNNPEWNKSEFLNNAERIFDNFFNLRLPVHTKDLASLKKNFLDMASTGFDNDPHNRVIASEKYLGPYLDENTGLKFGGIVDRIEQLDNGNYLIVDYKTYRDFKNIDDDIDSCFQVILYAYLYEKISGNKVEGCEYRYLRNENVIKCKYDQDTQNLLHLKLQKIKDAFDSGVFECSQDENSCKYCKLARICGKDKKEEQDG